MGKPALRIALLVSLIALADVPLAGAQSAGAAATPPAAALKAAPTVLTLITGDLVALDPAAGQQAGSGYQTLTYNTHVYVIPYDAAAYVGAPLDLSLFDVTALAAAGSAAAPLTLDITASSNSAAVPGITMTAPGKGKLDKALRFGQALRADGSARKQGKTTNLFAGIDRIAVAGTAKRPALVGKLYTLTVNGWDRKGKKVF